MAGRRGLVHYNSLSGRWKLFDNAIQEQSFKVQGGMQWYGSTLIVTTEEADEHGELIYAVSALQAQVQLSFADVESSCAFSPEIGL